MYMVKNNQDNTPAYVRNFIKDPPLLLKDFPYDDLTEFLHLGIEERFLEDEVIISEEKYINAAYLIVEGKVLIVKGKIPVIRLSTGNFMGETFLFSKNQRMATAISSGESRVLRFERTDVLNYFKRKQRKLFHIFTRNVIKIQQSKIDNMNVLLLQLKKRLVNTDD